MADFCNSELARDFFQAFGRLMVKALNDLPDQHKAVVAAAQRRGCIISAYCGASPPILTGYLDDPATGETVELFSIVLPDEERVPLH